MNQKNIKNESDKSNKEDQLNYLLYAIFQSDLASQYFDNDVMYGIKVDNNTYKRELKRKM